MSNIQLFNQDCIEGMQTLAGNSIDCIITDPPYDIGSMDRIEKETGVRV